MSKLYFYIGLPRSGKSTHSKIWQQEAPNRVVLCYDDYRHILTGQRFHQDSEDFVRATVLITAKVLLRSGYDVLLDDTHTSLKNVEKILDVDKNAIALIINTDHETCIKRAYICGHDDLYHPILRMVENLKYTYKAIKENKLNIEYKEIECNHQ